MTRAEYREYLQSPWWMARRYQALEEAGWRCQVCGARGIKHPYLHLPYGLVVHHLTYINLGHERAEDLMALCGRCHEDEHRVVLRGVVA